ncbi:MAG TPA: hypothetical protein P5519_06530 [Spirochaetia bacterium]|nr:hypothetical protein [Spirochaetales bacterium]HRS65529.1 hypothetical protein [Spirochaetia bacterium]HPD80445.1 hypothetical protein [Spirochaetales bacterium]HQG39879.1 hypothetical protein [Spirochaetales bacterium]HQK34628.1 hypothetical protein [Spirochaetales bacterium]
MQVHKSILIFCAAIVLLVSCSAKRPELPETPVLTKSPGWIIVTAKWVRLKEHPQEQARDIAFLRYKDMAELQRRIYVPETERIWCELKYELDGAIVSGWVEARDVLIVETKEQALTVLKTMQ